MFIRQLDFFQYLEVWLFQTSPQDKSIHNPAITEVIFVQKGGMSFIPLRNSVPAILKVLVVPEKCSLNMRYTITLVPRACPLIIQFY